MVALRQSRTVITPLVLVLLGACALSDPAESCRVSHYVDQTNEYCIGIFCNGDDVTGGFLATGPTSCFGFSEVTRLRQGVFSLSCRIGSIGKTLLKDWTLEIAFGEDRADYDLLLVDGQEAYRGRAWSVDGDF